MTCDKKTRAGTPCQRPAGWGTDHVGQGACKLHGGATPIKHGRYSKVARARLGEVLDELGASGDDPLDLLPELELVRASGAFMLQKFGPSPMVTEILERAARIADMIQKHQKAKAITLETLNRVVEQMGVGVARHVKDPAILAAIEREWDSIQLGS